MNSQDRLKAVVAVWIIFGLFAGILCHQGGVQVEDILVIALFAIGVVGATAELSGVDLADRLRRISTFSPPFDR